MIYQSVLIAAGVIIMLDAGGVKGFKMSTSRTNFVGHSVISSVRARSTSLYDGTDIKDPVPEGELVSAKSITKEIMSFFAKPASVITSKEDVDFAMHLVEDSVVVHLDGMHIITILFQSARSRRRARSVMPVGLMLAVLENWEKEWTERDISTFVYGIRSLDCVSTEECGMLKLAAKKIDASSAVMSGRAIGNALYGLQDITSDTEGAAELCAALAKNIAKFDGELTGQDIGIGMYGLQGMSADKPEVRALLSAFADKIEQSEIEFDAQALSNSLYGLQSMSSEYAEVTKLVSALATKVGESRPELGAQAIGAAIYGLQVSGS